MTKYHLKHLLTSSMVFTFLVGVTPAADQSDWRIYSEEANGNVYFFDASRVQKTHGLHTVWTRIRYKTSVMGASSYQSLLEIECYERTEKILQRTFFSDSDWEKPAMSTDIKAKPKRQIADGSATKRLFKILCEE